MAFDNVYTPSENFFSVLISNTRFLYRKRVENTSQLVVWFHNALLIVGKSISGYIAKGHFH
jgi:hypothetical protein